jgi:hypothetical protein
MEEKYRS